MLCCCCRTSSQISPVHNTKQNKCPLLIKPHNKCRPFVFPFILSTARGGRRWATGEGRRASTLLTLASFERKKKVALLLSCALTVLPPLPPHTPLIVVGLVSFTCAGDLPATHLHILKFIINNAATTEWYKWGRGRFACGGVWVH